MTKRNHILSTNGHGIISYHKHLSYFKPGELIYIPKNLPVNIYLYNSACKFLQLYLHKLQGCSESLPQYMDYIRAIDEVSRSSISTKPIVMHALEQYFMHSQSQHGAEKLAPVSIVDKMLPLIRHDLKRKWTAPDMCAQLFISSASLYRALKAEQTSFTELLTTERLVAAKGLLRQTHRSIDQISYECGFQSQSYFAKKFKEKYHISPTAYRKKR